jgi:thiol-disulfide isomerase/thioredoxin
MKSSALIALVLSGAALLGYVAYRTLLPVPETAPAANATVETPEAAPAAAIETPSAEAVDTLPEFVLGTLDGGRQSIFSWPDQALVINFWATWCAPCLREIPLLREFQTERGDDGVQVIGIAVDRLGPVTKFADEMAFNYPQLIGESDAIEAAASFGIDFFALPFTVFTDHERNVLGVHTGEIHREDLDNLAAVLADLRAGRIGLDEARARLAGRI